MACEGLFGVAKAKCLEKKSSGKRVSCRKQGLKGDALKNCRSNNRKNLLKKVKKGTSSVLQNASGVLQKGANALKN
tara:strand:- start:174 stop:401 length:228 start_codon:yes stop_codon:yes gene_type:complete